jgi:hypothetical protein
VCSRIRERERERERDGERERKSLCLFMRVCLLRGGGDERGGVEILLIPTLQIFFRVLLGCSRHYMNSPYLQP